MCENPQLFCFLAKDYPIYPGIYKMLDKEGNIIYIGKAKNLRSRLKHYFVNSLQLDIKTRFLVKQVVYHWEGMDPAANFLKRLDLSKAFKRRGLAPIIRLIAVKP